MARATREQFANGATKGKADAGRDAVLSIECCLAHSQIAFFPVSLLSPSHFASRDHDILSLSETSFSRGILIIGVAHSSAYLPLATQHARPLRR
jgi:hypothetical protein